MKCPICKAGETQSGRTTVTLNQKNTVVIIKDVPADICQNCGEFYLDNDVTDKVHQIAEAAVTRDAEIEIVRYAA